MLKKITKIIIFVSIILSINTYSLHNKDVKIIKGDHNYPPYEFLNKDGEPDGFNIDIFKAVAREMGIQFQLELDSWTTVKNELKDGKIDALVGMFKTPERDKYFDFSISHFIGSYFVFVRQKDYTDDFHIEDKIAIVQKDDLGYDYLKNNFKNPNIIVKRDLKDTLISLSNGEGDYVLSPRIQGEILLKKHKLKNLTALKNPLIQRKYCFAVKEGDEKFLATLNEGLNIIKQSGEYDKIYDKWFGIYEKRSLINRQLFRIILIFLIITIILFIFSIIFSQILRNKIKKVKFALFKRQKDWESVFMNTKEMIVLHELIKDQDNKVIDYKILECNKAFTDIVGVSRQNAEGKLGSEVYNSYPPPYLDIYQKVVNQKKTIKFDIFHNPLKKFFYISAVYVSENKFATVTSDITEFKNVEKALNESEVFYRTLFNNSANAVFLLSDDIIVDCNEKAVSLFGYKREEIIGLKPGLISPEYQNNDTLSTIESKEKIEEAYKQGIIEFEWLHKKKDNTIFYAEVILSPINIQSGNFIQAIVKDITERKKFEMEMKNIRLYLRSILDSMPSSIIGLDENLKIKDINISAEDRYGINQKDASGKRIEDVYPDIYHRVKKYIHNIELFTKDKIITERYKTSGKHSKYEEIIIYPLKSNNGGYVLRIDDITEKVSLEEIMIQTEKMMSVGGLAAGMAHEINNPLSGIIQGIQNTQRRFSTEVSKNIEIAKKYNIDLKQVSRYMEERKITRFLEGVSDSAKRAALIVNNMLDFARKSNFDKNELNINELIDDVIQLASSDYDLKKNYDFKHIDIKKDLEENIKFFKGAKQEIEQVFLNLLKNSAQELAINKIPSPTIQIKTYNKHNKVFVEFIDNGNGISEEIKNRIFEPFYTTKEVGVGTGLGLSVSYFIIKQNHNGEIYIDSEYKNGARFIISFPVS